MKSSNKNNKNKKLITILDTECEAFRIICDDEKKTENKYFIACGNNRLTDNQTLEKCREMIKNKDWQLIITMMYVINKLNLNNDENKNNK